jgi:hypothetical protein
MKMKEITENYKVTQSSPQGLELTSQDGIKMTLPPEKMAAIQANPQDPNKFMMNPQAIAPTDTTAQAPTGPQVGAEIEIPTEISAFETQDEEEASEDDLIGSGKNQDVGGDPTDSLVSDEPGHGIIDRSFEKFARNSMSPKDNTTRNVLPESDELSKWLTIAGLR